MSTPVSPTEKTEEEIYAEAEKKRTAAMPAAPAKPPAVTLDSAGKPVTSAAKPAAPPKPPTNPAAPVEPKIEDLYNAVGEGFAKSPPPAAAKPAAKPAAPDPAAAEAERQHQRKTDALQEESLRGSKDGRAFLRASRSYDQRTPGVLGVSQGGTGLTPEADWRKMHPKPVFAAAAPLAAAPGRAAAKPAAPDPAARRTAMRSIERQYGTPTAVNPADPKSVSITTGMREKLTATTGVPALNEPGKATMQLQVAETKAPADSALGLENFAGGTIDHNAINKLAAPDFTEAVSPDPLAKNYSPTKAALAGAAAERPASPSTVTNPGDPAQGDMDPFPEKEEVDPSAEWKPTARTKWLDARKPGYAANDRAMHELAQRRKNVDALGDASLQTAIDQTNLGGLPADQQPKTFFGKAGLYLADSLEGGRRAATAVFGAPKSSRQEASERNDFEVKEFSKQSLAMNDEWEKLNARQKTFANPADPVKTK